MQANTTRVIIINLFLLSVQQIASAQTSAQSFSGAVKDADGHPVSSVVVYLKSTNYKTETDEQGNFKLNAPAGIYQLVISRLGFKQVTKNVSITAGKDLSIPAITFTDKLQLGEVMVTQKTKTKEIKEKAFNVNVIDTKNLYNSAADLNQALNETSGVRVRQDGGVGSDFTFSLNGFY